jgi:hypothetical protein
MKYNKKLKGKHNSPQLKASSSRGWPTELEINSPLRSHESSHVMNYSYETDTQSPSGKSPPMESTFMKLKWPKDVETVPERGMGKKSENNSAGGMNETRKKYERKKGLDDVSLHLGDETNDEDTEGHENAESDGEELPVLPRAPVKRKLMSEARGAEKSTQRGRSKSGTQQSKKQRTPQIDASVITQLTFGKRPLNCVSSLLLNLCVLT